MINIDYGFDILNKVTDFEFVIEFDSNKNLRSIATRQLQNDNCKQQLQGNSCKEQLENNSCENKLDFVIPHPTR